MTAGNPNDRRGRGSSLTYRRCLHLLRRAVCVLRAGSAWSEACWSLSFKTRNRTLSGTRLEKIGESADVADSAANAKTRQLRTPSTAARHEPWNASLLDCNQENDSRVYPIASEAVRFWG